jgi:hypothetical protein
LRNCQRIKRIHEHLHVAVDVRLALKADEPKE